MDSDSSSDLPAMGGAEGLGGMVASESVFLKSLSALRDNVLTPALDSDSPHQAGSLLQAMGIQNQDSDSDIGS